MIGPIPRWISVVCFLISLLGLFVGGSLIFSPGEFLPNVDLTARGVPFLLHMWAVRQTAIASIIGISVLRRSVPMLQISLVAYSMMALLDVFIGVNQRDTGLIAGSAFFGLLGLVMCFRLSFAPGGEKWGS